MFCKILNICHFLIVLLPFPMISASEGFTLIVLAWSWRCVRGVAPLSLTSPDTEPPAASQPWWECVPRGST